jgi:hypothetical protein
MEGNYRKLHSSSRQISTSIQAKKFVQNDVEERCALEKEQLCICAGPYRARKRI